MTTEQRLRFEKLVEALKQAVTVELEGDAEDLDVGFFTILSVQALGFTAAVFCEAEFKLRCSVWAHSDCYKSAIERACRLLAIQIMDVHRRSCEIMEAIA